MCVSGYLLFNLYFTAYFQIPPLVSCNQREQKEVYQRMQRSCFRRAHGAYKSLVTLLAEVKFHVGVVTLDASNCRRAQVPQGDRLGHLAAENPIEVTERGI